jgi:hypothetical protein
VITLPYLWGRMVGKAAKTVPSISLINLVIAGGDECGWDT